MYSLRVHFLFKVKEKKERSGLMKRLAAIKRSKSPTVPAYSMDNPVFEDSSVPNASTSPAAHAVHSRYKFLTFCVLHWCERVCVFLRSGSCPSQLMQLPVAAAHHRPASLSARATKQKERPSVTAAQFSHALGFV